MASVICSLLLRHKADEDGGGGDGAWPLLGLGVAALCIGLLLSVRAVVVSERGGL